jgi:hypothetical protein
MRNGSSRDAMQLHLIAQHRYLRALTSHNALSITAERV